MTKDEETATLQAALDSVRKQKSIPVPADLKDLPPAELAHAAAEFVEKEAIAMPTGSPDDPFMIGSFRTCHNTGCDLRAGCMRYRLRKQRDSVLQGFYYPDEGCHVPMNDPEWYGKFSLDVIDESAL
jgi:hypothetical protein